MQNYKNISENICIQLLLDEPDDIGNRASFFTSKKWNPAIDKNIYITFLEDPPLSFPIKSISDLQNGNLNTILDPLQYKFSNSSIKPDLKETIKEIVAERIQPYISMNMIFVQPNSYPKPDIRITFNPKKGSYSWIGTDCRKIPPSSETLNFGWFDVGTVMHEFGHVLGLIHEHQSPLGNPIKWNIQAVYDWALYYADWDKNQVDRQIIYRYNQSEINGSNFDPRSIMLYFFPSSITLNNIGTSQNYILSSSDVIYINKQYPINSQNCNNSNRLCLNPKQFYLYAYNTDICDSKEYNYIMDMYTLELGECIVNKNMDQKTCYIQYIKKLKDLNDTILKIDSVKLNDCKKSQIPYDITKTLLIILIIIEIIGIIGITVWFSIKKRK